MVLFTVKMGNFPRPVPVFNQLREIRSSWWTFSQLRRTREPFCFLYFVPPPSNSHFSRVLTLEMGPAARSGQSEARSVGGRARTQENCRFCGENCCISVDQRSPSGAASGSSQIDEQKKLSPDGDVAPGAA